MLKVNETNFDIAYKYLLNEPYFNTYILGDIEKYGLENDKLSLFFQEKNNEIVAVLMKFMDDFVLYSHKGNCDYSEISEVIKNNSLGVDDFCVSGKDSVIKELATHFENKNVRSTNFALLNKEKFINSDNEAVKLTVENAQDILNVYVSIDEFSKKYNNSNGLNRVISAFEDGRTFGIFSSGELLAVASSTAECKFCAMVTNVGTLPECRGRGYASKVVVALLNELLSIGIDNICLYYDNPKAGSIYKKIGFDDIGLYSVLR